ncbi:hypothetical protein VTO73DRAFT_12871 [Trametes versicolor]
MGGWIQNLYVGMYVFQFPGDNYRVQPYPSGADSCQRSGSCQKVRRARRIECSVDMQQHNEEASMTGDAPTALV